MSPKTSWRVIGLDRPEIRMIRISRRGLILVLQGKDQRYFITWKWEELLAELRKTKWKHEGDPLP